MAEYLISEQQVPGTDNILILKDKEARNDLSTALATVTGNPLNFSTRSDQKAKETVISLEPIQDLHGYDHPWPAGGGKNVYEGSPSFDGYIAKSGWTKETETYNGHDVYSRNEAWGGMYKVVSLPVGTYTFSCMVKGDDSGSAYIYVTTSNTTASVSKNTQTVSLTANWSKVSITFDVTTAGTVALRIERSTGTIYISEYQLEEGSTATAYAPYSNYCPIDGRTETSLLGCGKNQMHCMVGTLAGITTTINDDGSITISGKPTNSGELDLYFDRDNPIVVPDNAIFSIGVNKDNTFSCTCAKEGGWYSIPSGKSEVAITSGRYYRFYFYLNYIHTYNLRIYPMIRLASNTDATYEPYVESNNLTIQFGEKVYGAKLELEKGTVTVDTAIVDLGTLNWTYSTNYIMFYAVLSGIKNATQSYCSIYKPVTVKLAFMQDKEITTNRETLGQADYIIVKDSAYTDAATFKAAMSGQQLCYELATPRTITLTPNEISLLMGVNNISTDGDSISLTYRDGKVATLGDLEDAANNLQEQIDQNETMEDETTQLLYKLGVNNGLLFMEEV